MQNSLMFRSDLYLNVSVKYDPLKYYVILNEWQSNIDLVISML